MLIETGAELAITVLPKVSGLIRREASDPGVCGKFGRDCDRCS